MEKLPKINILFEDNHVLVVEKPVNIPVCEDNSHDMDLLNLLKRYIKDKYNKPGNVYLGLIHRLDRPVGGIMVFAKTSKAASRLSMQVRDNKIKKYYYAVLHGKLDGEGEFVDYLIKDIKNNISYVTDSGKGKLSKLKYKCISYTDKENLSLVVIELETGRSHQIRVQFSSRNHPLVGDVKYGNDKNIQIALFAYKLSFYHPISKELLTFDLEIPKRYPFNIF